MEKKGTKKDRNSEKTGNIGERERGREREREKTEVERGGESRGKHMRLKEGQEAPGLMW